MEVPVPMVAPMEIGNKITTAGQIIGQHGTHALLLHEDSSCTEVDIVHDEVSVWRLICKYPK